MHDRVCDNTVAKTTMKVLYSYLFNIGCYSHTLDHGGEKFKKPVLDDLFDSG